ncbi:ferredoxin [Calderihabitans maritimus]|uniref:Ferredoxin n=1 Tax=Calderihabitans maritimus TaxID=1246530 RepID=A0A1Z5HU55_9FIRM|nr:ferredoxin [Calderihabitans maritimus]
MSTHEVIFYPDQRSVRVPTGTSLLKAAARAGIALKSNCGGNGTCGKCAVKVKQGEANIESFGNLPARLKKEGYVLACQTYVQGNLEVEIPPEAQLRDHQVLVDYKQAVLTERRQRGPEGFPLCYQVQLELSSPTLTENSSDLTRLEAAVYQKTGKRDWDISLAVLRELPEILRTGQWKVQVTLVEVPGRREIVKVVPTGKAVTPYGLAVDIGTTTVVVHLVNLETGQIVDRNGTYNRQAQFGDDVISRIIYASEEKEGLEELRESVVQTINELTEDLLKRNGVPREDVHLAVCAGNTTMTHLFMGILPKYIRLEPYIPAFSRIPPVKVSQVGLKINPEGWVLNFPAVASYVGGDIVAGVLVSGIADSEEIALFVDIGTNGEMVLGNKDWLVSCACSAGPAFEGGGITWGMRAMPGAIERLEIEPETFEVKVITVGDGKPVGICGSGLIDTLAKLRRYGIIDRSGNFERDLSTPRLREKDGEWEFVLVWSRESGNGEDIVITQSDIKNILRAKAAVFAGIRSLLKAVQLEMDQVQKVIIAGGFGNYLNIADAVEIGLLPDLPEERYEFIGNSAVKGAYLSLISQEAWQEAHELAKKMTYLELSVGTDFMEEFVSASFLPHTDLSLFPSLVHAVSGKEGNTHWTAAGN